MAKKVFKFQGKTIEEVKQLSIDELTPMLSSSVRRKLARGFTDAEQAFIREIQRKDGVKTHCRDMIVLPYMVGKMVKIHRGNSFDDIMIQPEMIGHRLGEFALSRKRVQHGSMGVGASKSSSNQNRK